MARVSRITNAILRTNPDAIEYIAHRIVSITIRQRGDVPQPSAAYQRFLEIRGWDPIAVIAEAYVLNGEQTPIIHFEPTSDDFGRIGIAHLPHPQTQFFKHLPPFSVVIDGFFRYLADADLSEANLVQNSAQYLYTHGYTSTAPTKEDLRHPQRSDLSAQFARPSVTCDYSDVSNALEKSSHMPKPRLQLIREIAEARNERNSTISRSRKAFERLIRSLKNSYSEEE